MKNFIWISLLLLTVACSADLTVEKGQYANYCNLDETGKILVTVKNSGSETAVASTTFVDFGPFGSMKLDTPTLAPGQVVQLPPVTIPSRCYNSDCDFKVILDIDNVVSEGSSGEANNVVIGTCIG